MITAIRQRLRRSRIRPATVNEQTDKSGGVISVLMIVMKKKMFVISAVILIQLYLVSSCNSGASREKDSVAMDVATIAQGESSFLAKCSSCHNFYLDGIGPQLAGITTDKPIDWIKNFIRYPKAMVDSGDSTAQTLYNRYKTLMPSFAHLPDEEINAIIAYLQTKKKQQRVYVKEDTNDIKNPIADSIRTSDLVVGVDSFTQVPASSDQPPFTRITKLDYQPNTGDLFVVDIRGKLYKLTNGKSKVYLDLASMKPKLVLQPGIATGFGSFTFHPQFQRNGILYTTHAEYPGLHKGDFNYVDTIPVMLQWVLTEWKGDPKSFPFEGTSREIFRIDMPTSIHGVQEIAFNPLAKPGSGDYGLLYIGIGDGGSAEIGSPLVSPEPRKVWGSILRIDPLGSNGRNGKYGIPVNNPFSKNDTPNFASEVYAYGFRNPHRISWTKSGKLLAINIGEHAIEALNMIEPGHFYGWPIREGTFVERFFNDNGKVYSLPTNDSIYHVTYPVAQFDHDEGTAISGGFEYHGTAIPELVGKYVFGDIGTGKLFYVETKDLKVGRQATIKKWHISKDGVLTSPEELCKNTRVDMRFATDSKGELYLLTKYDGKIYRLVKATRKPSAY
jgi:glucose/arabinose dehydrogenase/mono/diheme cytochrome c family protein